MNDTSGSGFSCHGDGVACEFNGSRCFILSGVLDNVAPSINNSFSYCYSTLTVTPGRFDSTSMLTQCADIQPLNITCAVSGHNQSDIELKSRSLPFRVAGIVIHIKMFMHRVCVYVCVCVCVTLFNYLIQMPSL